MWAFKRQVCIYFIHLKVWRHLFNVWYLLNIIKTYLVSIQHIHYIDFNCQTFFCYPRHQFWKFLHCSHQGGCQSGTVLCGHIIFWDHLLTCILRALNFKLNLPTLKYTICDLKKWYGRIAQCYSDILPGHHSEGIFKIDPLGNKKIKNNFLKLYSRAYSLWTITKK